ncbi:hypothetical protein [Yersinia sp. 2466 StPb PI]|uniref:hypothetical protein n=1 Tax=Yersinia sp. 2466 StPb PI TaxID=3061648 RepID=UPI00355BE1E0
MKQYESGITNLLGDIVRKLGAKLYGREFRLKTPESLVEKLRVVESKDINDILRYTIGFPYGGNGTQILI